MRIAIVGTGIAGNSAAYCLHHAPHVQSITVYERDLRIGGHAATVDIDYDGTKIAVDTGFIVYNDRNYPNLIQMFDHLGVKTQASDMSFAVSIDRGKLEWAGRSGAASNVINGLFAQRRNLANPRYWKMLMEVLRFQKQSLADLDGDQLGSKSLGEYLDFRRFSPAFRDNYIVPMGAAIWSTPVKEMLEFPASSFISFFENHRLLHWDRPVWRTVTGGSREYVRRLSESYKDRIRLGAAVTSITRDADGVVVTDSLGHSDRYDHVVIAAHAPDALAMLADASACEQEILSAVRYRPNDVYLHRDERLMPRRKAAWSAWNFLREGSDDSADVSVTYWMNLLQGIDKSKPLFVSLNPPFSPDPAKIFARFSYDHPQFDRPALKSQQDIHRIQGNNRTWFCGAWTGFGFHEDGIRSGLEIAGKLGAEAPWLAGFAHFSEAAE